MLTITRKGLLLTLSASVIPSQGSTDVPVSFVNDSDEYASYEIEPRVGYYNRKVYKSVVRQYTSSTKQFTIPAEAFKQDGVIDITIALIDSINSNHIEACVPVRAQVHAAPLGTVVLPDTDTWQTAVKNWLKQLYDNDYKPQFDKALDDINSAVDSANQAIDTANDASQKANEASEDAQNALNLSNETNDLINEKVENGDFIPDFSIGTVTTGSAGSNADISISGEKDSPVLNFKIPRGDRGEGIPTGSIIPFAANTPPSGWLNCDGSAVSRSTYAALFNLIGEMYGSGDGSTTFNLPNLQKRFPVGVGNGYGLGKTGGEETHTLTTEEMPEHTHNQKAHGHTGTGSASEAGNHTHTASSASAGAHTHALTINSGGSHTHSASTGSGGTHRHNFLWGTNGPTEGDNIMVGWPGGNSSNSWTNGGNIIADSGSHTHTVSVGSAGSHNHSGTANSAGGHSHTITVASAGAHTHAISITISETTAENENTGGGQAHNNMPPYIALNYIIKY